MSSNKIDEYNENHENPSEIKRVGTKVGSKTYIFVKSILKIRNIMLIGGIIFIIPIGIGILILDGLGNLLNPYYVPINIRQCFGFQNI